MRLTLLALLLAAALPPAAPARDALQAIDDCLARLDADLDVGYARIAARCPELTPTLGGSSFAPWLPADWQRPDNELTAAGLSELRAQLARESHPVPRPRIAPRSERVGAVLAALSRGEQPVGRSRWQRFKDWLRELTTTRPQPEEGWLSRALAGLKLPRRTLEVVGWAAFALVLVLAAGIVANELRIAGVFRRPGARRRAQAAQGNAARRSTTPDLAAIERAAPQERPALLLELIAARLAAQRRLPPRARAAGALTARELGQQAQLPQESARTPLVELVTVSEQVRFSAQGVAGPRLAAAVTDGRRVLAMLEATVPAAPGAV